MDPTSTGYPALLAPGASSSSPPGPVRCPGLPRLDEGLLPEDSPYEILDGRRILTMANPEHAAPQAQLAALLRAAAAPGCYALVELTTRADTAPPPPGLDPNAELPPTVNELRSDACVLREGTDPRTGDRFVEDLSFEVANEQSMADLKRKAARLTDRGVRRVFALLVKRKQVLEWSTAQQEFVPVVGEIRDPCLGVPLPVRAILDAAVAEDTMVRALDQKGNRALLQIRKEEHQTGLDEGKRLGLKAAVLDLCELLNIELSPVQRVYLEDLDLAGLEQLRLALKRDRRWPAR